MAYHDTLFPIFLSSGVCSSVSSHKSVIYLEDSAWDSNWSSSFPSGSYYEPRKKRHFSHVYSHKVLGGQAEAYEASLVLDFSSHTVTSAYFLLFKASHFSMAKINGQGSILLPWRQGQNN